MYKTCHKLVGTFISNHTIDLLAERFRLTELLLLCQFKEFLIGRSTPKEIRQSYCKFPISELSPVIRVIGFIEVEKSRGGKNNAQWQSDRSIKRITSLATKGKEIRKLLNIFSLWFDTPKGFQRKQLNHFLSPQRFIWFVGFCDPPIPPARFIGHIQRSFPLNPVNPQSRFEADAIFLPRIAVSTSICLHIAFFTEGKFARTIFCELDWKLNDLRLVRRTSNLKCRKAIKMFFLRNGTKVHEVSFGRSTFDCPNTASEFVGTRRQRLNNMLSFFPARRMLWRQGDVLFLIDIRNSQK